MVTMLILVINNTKSLGRNFTFVGLFPSHCAETFSFWFRQYISTWYYDISVDGDQVFLLLTLNPASTTLSLLIWCLHFSLWTSICVLGSVQRNLGFVYFVSSLSNVLLVMNLIRPTDIPAFNLNDLWENYFFQIQLKLLFAKKFC